MTRERTSLEIIAPDVEEALARAQLDLGVSSDQLRVDILDEGDPQSGRQARLRVYLEDADESADDPDINTAQQVVSDLLGYIELDMDIDVSARYGEYIVDDGQHPIMVEIHGEDLGVLIGHRGETLEGLEHIVRVIVSRTLGRRVNLFLDVSGYNARREQQLQRLAQRVADQVIHQGRAVSLEPMSPRERRIIHIALQDNSQVTSESAGEGRERRVTIHAHSTGVIGDSPMALD